jgi:hypothetical protein
MECGFFLAGPKVNHSTVFHSDTVSVADPGCFYPGSDHFIIPDRGSGSKHYFIPDPRSYMKSVMKTYFFLASCAFRSKVLVLKKKIQDKGYEIRKKFIPDLDPGSRG